MLYFIDHQDHWDSNLGSLSKQNKKLLGDKKALLIQNKLLLDRIGAVREEATRELAVQIDDLNQKLSKGKWMSHTLYFTVEILNEFLHMKIKNHHTHPTFPKFPASWGLVLTNLTLVPENPVLIFSRYRFKIEQTKPVWNIFLSWICLSKYISPCSSRDPFSIYLLLIKLRI